MRRRLNPSSPRAGFTLAELVVVIGIIAILVGLTTAAVVRVRLKVPEIQDRHDIQTLSTAIAQFQTDFSVDYIPSAIFLREDMAYNLSNPVEAASVQYLKKVWPRLAMPGAGFQGHDWNGSGAIETGNNGAFLLEGDQCLVFFLGGIPENRPGQPFGLQGFSNNVSYPAAPTSQRKGPTFDFKIERLIQFNLNGRPSSAFFRSYRDNWGPTGRPFAYFSGRSFGAATASNPNYRGYSASDCASLGVIPYHIGANPPVFFNRDGFQIISAGRDNQFGPGGAFDPRAGWEVGPTADDMSNFHPNKLGDPVQ